MFQVSPMNWFLYLFSLIYLVVFFFNLLFKKNVFNMKFKNMTYKKKYVK